MNTHTAYTQIEEARASGQAWGEQEVEAWRDQHDSNQAMPSWTRGTYCGMLPDDDTRDLIEAVIDLEAERVWNSAREEQP